MAPTITFLGEGTSTSLATTTDSASITATTGRPLIVWFATSNLVFDASAVTLDPTGTPQAFTRRDRNEADGANDCTGELWVLDAPTTVSAIVRVTHQNNASARTLQVCEITGHDTSTSTAWRDALATSSIVTSGTTHEVTVTSEAGDLPLAFASIRQTASGPNLSNNGSTTTVDNVLGGTTIRGRILSGTGAASVTLGGTTASATQSVVMGFNVNAAVAGSPPVADFSADATTGTQATVFTFTDVSTNTPTSWLWDFGDGNTSTSQNPTHSYATDGTYTVELTAYNGSGSDTETKTGYITVLTAPVAAFSADVVGGAATLTVTFTDASTNAPTSWLWDFDDPGGTETSTSQNPTYGYTTPGTYSVKLTATNAAGSGSLTKTDYITVSAPGTEANRVRRGQRFLRAAAMAAVAARRMSALLQRAQLEGLARFTPGGTQGTGASTSTGGATSTGGRVRHLSLLRLNRRRR